MITDTVILEDSEGMFYISQLWRNIPKSMKVRTVLETNPFERFERVHETDFEGTLYKFGRHVAVNYINRPRFCRWVLFNAGELQTVEDLINLVCDLQNTGALPIEKNLV